MSRLQAVQSYLDKHELTKKVEDAINATVKAKPEEPTAFLVRCPNIILSYQMMYQWAISGCNLTVAASSDLRFRIADQPCSLQTR